jgi:hypothetical protein
VSNLASVSVDSQPAGLVPSLNAVTNVGTGFILPDCYGETNGYRFAYWLLNGQILVDQLGRARGGASLVVAGNTTARAVFIDVGADANSNNTPDWFEYHFCAALVNSATDDDDGDGFSLLDEYRCDYDPQIPDEIRSGASRWRSHRPPMSTLVFSRARHSVWWMAV